MNYFFRKNLNNLTLLTFFKMIHIVAINSFSTNMKNTTDFLLDYGYVESVGSVLPLLKVY